MAILKRSIHEQFSNEISLNLNQTASKKLLTYVNNEIIKIPCHKHCNNKFVRGKKTNGLSNCNRCKSSSSFRIITRNEKYRTGRENKEIETRSMTCSYLADFFLHFHKQIMKHSTPSTTCIEIRVQNEYYRSTCIILLK